MAVLLILVGTVGAITCAFRYDDLAGWATVSVAAILAGFAVGFDW